MIFRIYTEGHYLKTRFAANTTTTSNCDHECLFANYSRRFSNPIDKLFFVLQLMVLYQGTELLSET
jgi:hypothetical protein